ncbi:MAG: hypothetical protein KBA51_06645 [Kiritimatiellae bacterium]|nr:hypothetical protein [Kiritimatiellia bacterium]
MRSVGRRRWIILLCAGIALIAGAALRLCPDCGHEAEGSETVCGHCGAALPAEAPAPAVEPTPEPESPAAGPDLESVRSILAEQARTARALEERKAWWGAMLFSRNAAALAGLAGVEGVKIQREMEALQWRARDTIALRTVSCPSCEGAGTLRKLSITLSGEPLEQVVAGGSCPVCRGRGTLPGKGSADLLRREETDAQRTYDFEQRQRGLESWMGIYVLPGLIKDLSPRDLSALRKGFGVWCAECRGFRKISCEACEGTGAVACTGNGCVQGRAVCEACGGRGRVSGGGTSGSSSRTSSSGALSTRCEACGGLGLGPCTTCKGRGYLICSQCKGEGDTLCRACGGSGMPAVCSKCKGDGVTPCARCRGSGRDRRGGECEACGGHGEILCKTCEGSGRAGKK